MSDTPELQKIHVPVVREAEPSSLPVVIFGRWGAKVGLPIRYCQGTIAELNFLNQNGFYTYRTESVIKGRGSGESVSRKVGFVGLVTGIEVVPKDFSTILRPGDDHTVEEQLGLSANSTNPTQINKKSKDILKEFPWVDAFTKARRGTTWLAIYGENRNGDADRIYEATLYIDEMSGSYWPPTELMPAHLDGIGPIQQIDMYEVLSSVLDSSKNLE